MKNTNEPAVQATDTKPRFDLVKKDAIVLFMAEMYGEKRVETANVLRIDRGVAMLLWLDGHSSRNDDVKVEELLAVYDKAGPNDGGIFPFTGPGHLLPAGKAYLEKNPNPVR